MEGKVLLELKCVDLVAPVHAAQVLSYLRLLGLDVGLLVNFNSVVVRKAIRRFVRSSSG